MYLILFLSFVVYVHSDDNQKIPNVADLPVFPGSVGNVGNSDGSGPPGLGGLGLAPLTNIGSGPVGNIGQGSGLGGIGNLPIVGSQSNGESGIGNLPVGSQSNGQGGIGVLPIVGSQNNGLADLGNLTNVIQPNSGSGGIANLQIVGTQSNGQGGISNLPLTGSQNNGLADPGNLPDVGQSNNGGNGLNQNNGGGFNQNNGQSGFNQNNGQGGFNQNNGQGGFNRNNGQGGFNQNNGQGSFNQNNGGGFNRNNGGSGFNQNNGQGGFNQNNGGGFNRNNGGSGFNQNNGQGGFNQNGTQGQLSNLVPALVADLESVLNLGNFNDFTGIERPCQVFDIYCIRRYFKKNSKCKEVRGPVPEPYYRTQSSLQITTINATFSAFNVLYEGLNGRIVEFYINRRTDKLVISIEFRNVTFFSRDVYYRFYRRSREPITTYDYLYLNYRSFITTTIIPKVRDLQLYKSETNTFTNDAIPSFSIGPNAFSYPDSTVQLSRIELLANLPTFVQEAQLTEGPFAAATFIQNSICDFKLKVL